MLTACEILNSWLLHLTGVKIPTSVQFICEGLGEKISMWLMRDHETFHSACSTCQEMYSLTSGGDPVNPRDEHLQILRANTIKSWRDYQADTACTRGQKADLAEIKLEINGFNPSFIHPKVFSNLIIMFERGKYFNSDGKDLMLVNLKTLRTHQQFTLALVNLPPNFCRETDNIIDGLTTITRCLELIIGQYGSISAFFLKYSTELPEIFGYIQPSKTRALAATDSPIVTCSVCGIDNVLSHSDVTQDPFKYENQFPPSNETESLEKIDSNWLCGLCAADLAHVYDRSGSRSCGNCFRCL